ncbi:MAG: Glycosyl transferase family 2 [Candidatus Woesebacteria bacterium GW2011_GWA1_37_8]|uniref:Glycosyl transferase family 2 n=2 Tax=Candidatus Woeseibacteriota TaxID=1752722 RepID=A0A0G0LFH8_9BACT|nr:MAG: Glycosyl transferase family 2 [Microgenomates group bacterium GW2011_GWC1_37_12b]KKQ46083.1 MAG: Glycosyl transferase family 2 [Candidatus Woesebacteria bacterium GW2011_GWA1_37_8]KKQ86690.1 MAG: Glycosyl transferase family 2 [Candidatus Woesebacteria bacterium GW2011_GWB1_38_8b]
MKLSVVLAVKNEEENIGACLDSVKQIADEMIVVDDGSSDKTVEIAKKHGAKVFSFVHKNNFHETKQFAIERAKGDWVLQLDADERVTKELADEIKEVVNFSDKENQSRVLSSSSTVHNTLSSKHLKLFLRHQKLIEQREGHLGKKTGEVVAFFITRRNFFLGRPLIHAGVYPDGVIRLIKNGKARLPAKSVHELMEIDGEVGWLFNDLEHHDSPTLKRYLDRMNRYTDLQAKEFETKKIPATNWNLFKYSFIVPSVNFLKLYFRHKGILDGRQGFLWSVFSSLHFPITYFKYYQSKLK